MSVDYFLRTHEKIIATALMLWLENGRTGEIRTRDQRIKSPLLYRELPSHYHCYALRVTNVLIG